MAAFAMMAAGAQATYLITTNRTPAEITLAEFHKHRPAARWLKLTECELDLLNARHFNYVESDHAPEFLVPLRPVGAETNAPIHALLSLQDEKLEVQVDAIAIADITRTLGPYLATNTEPLTIERDIEGVVRFGLENIVENREELRSLHPRLAEDFVIIDAGAKPSWLVAAMLPAGLGIAIWLWRNRREKKEPATDQPPQSQSLQQ